MSKVANYRKLNDRSYNSSTYHKKDGTPIREILKRESRKEVLEMREEDESWAADIAGKDPALWDE